MCNVAGISTEVGMLTHQPLATLYLMILQIAPFTSFQKNEET